MLSIGRDTVFRKGRKGAGIHEGLTHSANDLCFGISDAERGCSNWIGYNGQSMDELAAKFAVRDRYLRKLALAKSPEERMRDMAALQARMWATMRSSPAGYAHFLRRNFKARAVDVRKIHG